MAKKLVNDKKNGIHVTIDNLPELMASLKMLTRDEVLVGVPQETTGRDDPTTPVGDITNASLAYIHDNGAPERNIPARPFMIPGMERSQSQVTDLLARTAQYALQGSGKEKIAEGYTRVGLAVVGNIQNVIREGIAPELAEATLEARARKGRKGAAQALAFKQRGQPIPPGLVTPLIDTGEMLKSITYVIRKRSQRTK